MKSALTIPPGDDEWAGLPQAVKEEVRQWILAFEQVALVKPIQNALAQIAKIAGKKPKTVRAKYDQLRKGGDWRVFVDYRKLAPSDKSRVSDPRFQQFIKKMFEDHKRSSATAIEQLYTMWRRKDDIPGYEGWPGWPNIPQGWSERNLYRQLPTKTELKVFHIGMSAAYAGLPQVFSTRVGLWPMSHVMHDDMWHNDFIRVGERGAVARVLELDSLCVHSGKKVAWGTKPRLPKGHRPEQMEGLKEREMRMLVASLFFTTGYSPRGTVNLTEHGTAAIRERTRRILFDATGGKIIVRDSGITGDEQGVLSSWRGDRKGNPRFKAALESLRNAFQNRMDALPGQTGRNRDERPEVLAHMLDYQVELLELAARLPEQRRSLLIHPLWDYHSQFVPFLMDFYREFNNRSNHSLEGWHDCGYITNEYRLAPNVDAWLNEADLLALPSTSRQLLHDLVKSQPQIYSKPRRLSPTEVFAMGAADLIQIGPDVVCDLLIEDCGREEKVKGSYFTFSNLDIAPSELRYEARIIAPGSTRERELPEGEKYMVFVNPFSPDWLFVCDAKKAFLGLAKRVHGVSRLDEAGLIRALGRASERTADRLAPARMRHAEEGEAHRHMVETNKRLADESRAITTEERDAVKTLKAATRFGRAMQDATVEEVINPAYQTEDFSENPEPQQPEIRNEQW